MRLIILMISSLLLFSCSKKSSNNDNPTNDELADAYCATYLCPSGPPEIVSYPTNNISLTINDVMPSITPVVKMNYYTVTFRTSRDLPNGINFNKETGEISGVASALYELKEILIIADNRLINSNTGDVIAGGVDVYPLTFEVVDVPPLNLKLVNEDEYLFYNETQNEEDKPDTILNLELDRGVSISPLVFEFNEGGSAREYKIEPELPVGMSFNGYRLTGRPLISQLSKNYKFTFRNSGGETEFDLSILVKGVAPSNLSYLNSDISYKAGLEIDSNIPIYEGDLATNFSIEPALPIGLYIDTQNGQIKGNPEEILSNQSYTVTASNNWGNTSTVINITIQEFISDIETGDNFSCGIKNKKVYCWGKNNLNQLGHISTSTCLNQLNESNPCSKTPNAVTLEDDSVLRSLKLSSSKATTCSINPDKSVDCWGDNSFGQLGHSDSLSNSVNPVKVKVNNENNLLNINKIYAGNLFHCALDNSNDVYCWGDNSYNQINNSGTTSFIAEKVISDVDDFYIGLNKICYKKDSVTYCKGRNKNNTISSSTDEIIAAFSSLKDENELNILNISNLVLGESYSLLLTNNDYYSWGLNSNGQMFSALNSSVFPSLVIDSNILNSTINLFSIERNGWCFKNMNSLKCIGYNNNTFLVNENVFGDNFNFTELDVADIFEISSKSYSHRCYSKENLIFCGGENLFGELGNDTNNDSIDPVNVIFE